MHGEGWDRIVLQVGSEGKRRRQRVLFVASDKRLAISICAG